MVVGQLTKFVAVEAVRRVMSTMVNEERWDLCNSWELQFVLAVDNCSWRKPGFGSWFPPEKRTAKAVVVQAVEEGRQIDQQKRE